MLGVKLGSGGLFWVDFLLWLLLGFGKALALLVGSRGAALGSRLGVSGPSAEAGLRRAGASKPSGDEARLESGLPGLSGEVQIRTPGLQSA